MAFFSLVHRALRRNLPTVTLLSGVAFLLAACFHTLDGTVTDAQAPIAGAVVRLRATENSTVTDEDGRFKLPISGFPLHRTVTAWKEGYYIGAADLSGLRTNLTIELRPLPAEDNPQHVWLPSGPDPNVELACGNCHVELHDEWRQTDHANAARNPLVLAFYNGVDAAGKPNVGAGYRLDFPDEVGNCAACHAPAAVVDQPAGVDLNHVSGEAANGVFCHFCHAIRSMARPYAETTTGANALDLLRPPADQHLFIGPYDDVPGRDAHNPLYKQSQVCAACHSGGWWGVEAYTSFEEWQSSPYAQEDVQCQDCHMAPDGETTRVVSPCAPASGELGMNELLCQVQACIECHFTPLTARFDDPTTAIPLIPARQPQTISTHGAFNTRDETFLRRAVAMTVTAVQGIDGVLATVSIANVGAGHHLPTDSPLRNMILVVDAHDAEGQPLAQVGGPTVPDWGGSGAVDAGNYAGLPGKGFARVMEDYDGNVPAPPWRNGVRVHSDTRIPARAVDRSTFAFALPQDRVLLAPVTVEAKLVYRRVFKPWLDEKGFALPDVTLAAASVASTPQAGAVLADVAPVYDSTLFAPSSATTVTGEEIASGAFAAPEQCAACHRAEDAAWRASAHSWAATSPLYRARVKVASQNTHMETAPFCAGCHAPIGLVSGQIHTRWTWFGQENRPLDAAAQTGVSCAVCHGIATTTGITNGAYVLNPSSLPETSSPANLNAASHKADVQRSLYTQPEFCATCHDAVNPYTGLAVMSTYQEWRASRFNTGDPSTSTTCQDCHFADGRHGSLRADDLTSAASLHLTATHESGSQEMLVRVGVSNVGAGHDLPTGSSELQKLWLVITVSDATGKRLFITGDVDEYDDPVAGSISYGVTWLDAEGRPTERLWEAATVERDHRIAAGATVTEELQVAIPADAVAPLRVTASLQRRAASGYLTSLMGIYLQEEIPQPETVELVRAEVTVADRSSAE
jgi:hypothetical protein